MSPVYEFRQELARGHDGEHRVARWLMSHGYGVEMVDDLDRQKLGVDLVVSPPFPPSYTVEVKTDYLAHRTGNAFIEYVQNDTGTARQGGLGWVVTCRADWLLYLVAETGDAYWLRPRDVYRAFWSWWRRRDIRKHFAQNAAGYRTHGLCVPLSELSILSASEAVVP